ncbi:MAG: ComF family protein [Alphaproteobacteria bacterium]
MESPGGIADVLPRGVAAVLDALLPPRCLACQAAVDGPGRLCPACWRDIDFIAPPYCGACGFPFDFDAGEGALCGDCASQAPAFDRARAALRYGGAARKLILGFKHGDRTHAAPAFAGWMVRVGADLVDGADLVVPVPLHRRRLFARRYNQAALLALAIGRLSALRVVPDLLVRVRPTPSQAGRNRRRRFENVRGAFAVRARYRAGVEGRRVLVVDDVLTTGATVGACANTLKRAGAARVNVVTLARVAHRLT